MEGDKNLQINGALLVRGAEVCYAMDEVRTMDSREIGTLLARLRAEQGMTQKAVAERLNVSSQAVSKWERGKGCPDISLLPDLSRTFGVSLARLLEGDLTPAPKEAGNMKRVKFYVCPDCGNILTASGGGELHCCGRRLEPLKPRRADEAHMARVESMEEDWYITFPHPMEKCHFFRFAAYVTLDKVLLVRLYPEQGGEVRFPQIRGGTKLYLCCSRDGLFEIPMR